MWVYSDKDMDKRFGLDAETGLLLDYLLFLHCDETHSAWRCRPLGMQSITKIALSLIPTRDYSMFPAVAAGLTEYRKLSFALKDPLPNVNALVWSPIKTLPKWAKWSSKFLDWLKKYDDSAPNEKQYIREKICDKIEQDLIVKDYNSVVFWVRRLAIELSDLYSSERETLQRIKHIFLNDNQALALREKLNMLISTNEKYKYTVRFNLGPVGIPSRIARIPFWKGVRLITEKRNLKCRGPEVAREEPVAYSKDNDDTEDDALCLYAVEIDEEGHSPEGVTLKAIADCQEILHQLRIRYYIRTHLIGAVCVKDMDGNHCHISLPQPFWAKKSGKGAVPQLPPKINAILKTLSEDERTRWIASRWHISQAIGHWQEDTHKAASEVWQALECFSEERSKVLDLFVKDYLRTFPKAALTYLLKRLTRQAELYSKRNGCCDWQFYNSKEITLDGYLGNVLDINSSIRFSGWSNPPYPLILFEPNVGLVLTMSKHYNDIYDRLASRIKEDLSYLYGVRNAVVHRGEKLGNPRWVGYLARLGLEMILSIMNDKAKTIP